MPPPIRSARITSAPNCANVSPASGAAMKAELSMTRSGASSLCVIRKAPPRWIRNSRRERPGGSCPLEKGGDALPAADTHRLEAIARLPALHLVQQRRHDAHAGRTDRMAERNARAV